MNASSHPAQPETTPPKRAQTPSWRSLGALFLLALVVRCVGLTWGLPNATRWYSYHPDESARQIVGAVVSLLQGDFNPHFFNYPSLSVYATWAIYQLQSGFGLGTTAISPPYPWPVVRDVILAGRIFSALCGAATAPLVFLIARRLGRDNEGQKWAVLAGILAALAPGHVQHSHFATVDVPATLFVIWCVYLTLSAKTWRGLLGAALVAGLAAGTKYNAGLVLIVPLLRLFWPLEHESVASMPLAPATQVDAAQTVKSTHSPQQDKGFWRALVRAIVLIAVALGGFLLSTPYALLAPREFWGDGLRGGESGFAYELLVHPKIGSGEIFQGTGNGWIYHFTFNLPFVLTWPLVIGALIGIYFATKRREFWPILAFCILFYVSLGLSQVRFMRYLLPLTPLLCLFAANGAARLPRPRVWGVILVLFAAWGAKDVLWPLTHLDSRDQAAQVLRGQSVSLLGNPWFYTPPFQPQGFNTPVAGVRVTGGQIGPSPMAISEFEWRESRRLGRLDQPAIARIGDANSRFRSFKNEAPFALPGRDFVPHDYLYTHPQTRIY